MSNKNKTNELTWKNNEWIGYVWFPENVKERKKNIKENGFISLDDMENMMEKKYKEKY